MYETGAHYTEWSKLKRNRLFGNRLLDSVGEGESEMFQENSIETCISSRVKQSTSQVGYMRLVLRPGALWRPRRIGWRGRWERGSGWGIHVYPRLIYVNVSQKPLQYCKVISLQLIKKRKKERKGRGTRDQISSIHWIIEKARVPEKNLLQLYWLRESLWLCGSQKTVENSSSDGTIRPPYLPLEKSVCRPISNS